MPRIKVTINKTNQGKIDRFLRKFHKSWSNDMCPLGDSFDNDFVEFIKSEIRSIKDCNEKSIVESYLDECSTKYIDNDGSKLWSRSPSANEILLSCRPNVRQVLVKKYTDKTFDNNIDIYFNEVKKQYIMHPQDECDSMEFNEENKETFIKNNLKLVVNCAKRYRGLGLSFEDLIQAGNEGLLAAFERFDPNKSDVRNSIIKDIKQDFDDGVHITKEDASTTIMRSFTYGNFGEKAIKRLPENGFICKEEFIDWVRKNIKGAVFASVAFQWIRSSILTELSKNSDIVKLNNSPDGKKYADLISLDSINPYTNDNYHDNDLSVITNEQFIIENEQIENEERIELMREVIDEALMILSKQERRVIKKKFGIALPYSLTITEIADSEGISESNVKIILKEAKNKIENNLNDNTKSILKEMLDR